MVTRSYDCIITVFPVICESQMTGKSLRATDLNLLDPLLLRRFFWNRKSQAFYREAMGTFISSSRQKSTMSGIGIVVVVVDDRN